ncbi:MAG: hypothetical protein ACK6A7_09115 [Planctomycetota bacterium]|jgi:hypothetical protein
MSIPIASLLIFILAVAILAAVLRKSLLERIAFFELLRRYNASVVFAGDRNGVFIFNEYAERRSFIRLLRVCFCRPVKIAVVCADLEGVEGTFNNGLKHFADIHEIAFNFCKLSKSTVMAVMRLRKLKKLVAVGSNLSVEDVYDIAKESSVRYIHISNNILGPGDAANLSFWFPHVKLFVENRPVSIHNLKNDTTSENDSPPER